MWQESTSPNVTGLDADHWLRQLNNQQLLNFCINKNLLTTENESTDDLTPADSNTHTFEIKRETLQGLILEQLLKENFVDNGKYFSYQHYIIEPSQFKSSQINLNLSANKADSGIETDLETDDSTFFSTLKDAFNKTSEQEISSILSETGLDETFISQVKSSDTSSTNFPNLTDQEKRFLSVKFLLKFPHKKSSLGQGRKIFQ